MFPISLRVIKLRWMPTCHSFASVWADWLAGWGGEVCLFMWKFDLSEALSAGSVPPQSNHRHPYPDNYSSSRKPLPDPAALPPRHRPSRWLDFYNYQLLTISSRSWWVCCLIKLVSQASQQTVAPFPSFFSLLYSREENFSHSRPAKFSQMKKLASILLKLILFALADEQLFVSLHPI